jgi:hypothetical protein
VAEHVSKVAFEDFL